MSPKKKKILILVSSVLAVAILVSVLLLVLFACNKNYYDYRSEELSPYITVTPEALAGYTAAIDPRKVITDADVEAEIQAALEKDGELRSYPDLVPALSDTVALLYRVTLDGKDIHGFTNYYSGTEFTVALSAPTGEDEKDSLPAYYLPIREALVEALVANSSAPSAYYLKEKKEGTVMPTDAVYASITLQYTKDNVEKKDNYSAVRFEIPANYDDTHTALSPHDFLPDALYRELLKALTGAELGKAVSGEVYSSSDGVLYTFQVTPLFTAEEKTLLHIPLPLPADFDTGGSLAYLAGKTVEFIAIPTAVVKLETPEFNDAYVEKMTGGVYKGEGAAEEFRTVLKEYMQLEADGVFEEALYASLLETLTKKLVPTAFPEKALDTAYRDAEGLFKSSYDGYVAENGSAAFPTLESYLNDTFEVATDEERIALIDSLVKEVVAEYLAVYATAKHLDVMPTKEAVDNAYKATLADMSDAEIESYAYYYGDTYLFRQVEYEMVKEGVLSALQYTLVPKK